MEEWRRLYFQGALLQFATHTLRHRIALLDTVIDAGYDVVLMTLANRMRRRD